MPVPVITVAQMREWEKVTWSSGVTEDAVMRNAGAAVARCAERMTAEGDLILFLAGKGHNGDDAAYGCEFIQGRRAELMRVLDPEASGRELQARLDRRPALIVDGLFGIGLNRPLSGAWMNLIDQINRAGVPILAVDVPSGLNSYFTCRTPRCPPSLARHYPGSLLAHPVLPFRLSDPPFPLELRYSSLAHR